MIDLYNFILVNFKYKIVGFIANFVGSTCLSYTFETKDTGSSDWVQVLSGVSMLQFEDFLFKNNIQFIEIENQVIIYNQTRNK